MSDGQCRLTVAGPNRRVDLALPARVPLAVLLPDLVRLAAAPADGAAAPAQWVLGRLGDPPMTVERTLADYAVLDGETLFLTDAAEPVGPALTEPARGPDPGGVPEATSPVRPGAVVHRWPVIAVAVAMVVLVLAVLLLNL
ncbi:MAG: EsaB/YukD family protein [Actinomycetota bacterium]|nr:EsaB/YukD family protein [Actinomycetota bacterium]